MTPIPAVLAPLAEAVVGSRAVGFRHGRVTRRALAAAGKQAATVGTVVHLPVRPEAAPLHVVAHELVHAARPSPVPRFFADEHRSAEEHTARVVGEQVWRAAPAGSLAAPARAFSPPAVVGPAPRPPASAAGLAAVAAATARAATLGAGTAAAGPAGAVLAAGAALAGGAPDVARPASRSSETARPIPTAAHGGAIDSGTATQVPVLRRRLHRPPMSFGTAGLAVNDRRGGSANTASAALAPANAASSAVTAPAGTEATSGSAPSLVPGGSFSAPPGFGATTIHRRASPEVISRFTTGGDMLRRSSSDNEGDGTGAGAPVPPATTKADLDDELFERLVVRLEARLRSDFERRGRWFGSELP